jgi:hypothetical protein
MREDQASERRIELTRCGPTSREFRRTPARGARSARHRLYRPRNGIKGGQAPSQPEPAMRVTDIATGEPGDQPGRRSGHPAGDGGRWSIAAMARGGDGPAFAGVNMRYVSLVAACLLAVCLPASPSSADILEITQEERLHRSDVVIVAEVMSIRADMTSDGQITVADVNAALALDPWKLFWIMMLRRQISGRRYGPGRPTSSS